MPQLEKLSLVISNSPLPNVLEHLDERVKHLVVTARFDVVDMVCGYEVNLPGATASHSKVVVVCAL
eukprot:1791084-Karenia_brevis.AAC.1